MKFKTTQQEIDEAFELAISERRLTRENAENYMYMGTNDAGQDLFKNRDTRCYLAFEPIVIDFPRHWPAETPHELGE